MVVPSGSATGAGIGRAGTADLETEIVERCRPLPNRPDRPLAHPKRRRRRRQNARTARPNSAVNLHKTHLPDTVQNPRPLHRMTLPSGTMNRTDHLLHPPVGSLVTDTGHGRGCRGIVSSDKFTDAIGRSVGAPGSIASSTPHRLRDRIGQRGTNFMSPMKRSLHHYPQVGHRRAYLILVVFITVSLYYSLYAAAGVTTLLLEELRLPFQNFVYILAAGNLVGAFASLLAGLADRFGRANLVVYGLLIVGLLVAFVMPNVTTSTEWSIAFAVISFVEGVILVATPALIRDFSPQVGRATAMGFWTVGPVLGSLTVSLVTTITLPIFHTWQSAYEICGAVGLFTFVVAFLFLKELAPELRDQLMVSERDRTLIELRAKGLNIEASLRNPWRQMLHLDVIGSAFGVSALLFFYYTAVAFGLIYYVTVFQFSVDEANELGNWSWAANAVALILAGLLSDRLRVRKPFMVVGGLGGLVFIYLFLIQAGGHPSFLLLTVLSAAQSFFVGIAYVFWMASFTETVEARNPALTATGLAIWGWLVRLVVTGCFVGLPFVVRAVNPLITAPGVIAAYKEAVAANTTPSPALVAALDGIKAAAAAAPGEWQNWYWICEVGILVFLATIFLMRGRWSPAAALADETAHDALVARELAELQLLRGVEGKAAAE